MLKLVWKQMKRYSKFFGGLFKLMYRSFDFVFSAFLVRRRGNLWFQIHYIGISLRGMPCGMCWTLLVPWPWSAQVNHNHSYWNKIHTQKNFMNRIFGHEGKFADDVIYLNWLMLMLSGIKALERYNPATGVWMQVNILNIILHSFLNFIVIFLLHLKCSLLGSLRDFASTSGSW